MQMVYLRTALPISWRSRVVHSLIATEACLLLTMGTTAFFEEIRKEEARFGELFTLHFRTKYDERWSCPYGW